MFLKCQELEHAGKSRQLSEYYPFNKHPGGIAVRYWISEAAEIPVSFFGKVSTGS